jgi:hypothetical protein
VLQGLQLTVAPGQPEGAGLDALRQVATCGIGAAVGFGVFEGPGVFLTQADGLAQPQLVEGGKGRQGGWIGFAHEGLLGQG